MIDLAPPDFRVDWGALDARFDWIRAMRGVTQDPIHHAEGDVWIHTRMVAEAMAGLEAFRSSDRRPTLITAALLHDVAKPFCSQHAEGRVTTKGHSTKGALLARRILWRMGAPLAEREAIANMVRHHQAPFWLLEREDPRELALRIAETTPWDLLSTLAEADARGRICQDLPRILDNIALFREYGRELQPFPSAHARFLYFQGRQRDPYHAPHEDFRCEVVLMSGFPGAGKDRYIAEHLRDWPVVSLDRLREELDVDPADDQGSIVQRARDEARAHLRAGRSFVWNATNLSRRIRSQCIRLFADYGARVRIVYVEVDEETLRAQNREREKPVPDRVLEALLDHWEMPDATEAHEVATFTGTLRHGSNEPCDSSSWRWSPAASKP